MAEPRTFTFQSPSENPWYMLATARKDDAANRDLWNGYMRHLIREEEADNLERGDGTPIILPTLSPDEMGWITSNIPGLPRELPRKISLSGLTFAEDVNFRDFYFPVSVSFAGSSFTRGADFAGSTFAGDADFMESTFAVYADFEKSTFTGDAIFVESSFTGDAIFAKSTFTGTAAFAESTFTGTAAFAESTFTGAAAFAGSTFAKYADFMKSTFTEAADFEGSTFAEYAIFAKSTFERQGDFAKSTFTGTADFSKSKYEDKTSFQNVTFKVAPLFFATTLHEDTDWTGITWPDTPAAKEDATQYVRRYDRLALIMSTLKQPDNEHLFFRLSMRAKEVRDGWGISTGLSRLYGLFFCYGWGLKRALGLWVLHILLGAGYLWVMALWQMSQPLPTLTALAISFSNSLPFLGLQRGPVENAYNAFHTLTGFNMLWMIQSLSGSILLFFLLLTIRNRFRLR